MDTADERKYTSTRTYSQSPDAGPGVAGAHMSNRHDNGRFLRRPRVDEHRCRAVHRGVQGILGGVDLHGRPAHDLANKTVRGRRPGLVEHYDPHHVQRLQQPELDLPAAALGDEPGRRHEQVNAILRVCPITSSDTRIVPARSYDARPIRTISTLNRVSLRSSSKRGSTPRNAARGERSSTAWASSANA